MFQAFFNGLSGMYSFSSGLQTVSNNIANMNTPGFRGSDSFFRSIDGGLGTQIDGSGLRVHGGEMRQTGNPTDLALNGSGFFILRDDTGNTFYTRAGQFQFDENGVLVDAVTKARVAGIDSAGNLVDIDISSFRSVPPVATTEVTFQGILSTTGLQHNVSSIVVYDNLGKATTLSVRFFRATATTTDPNTNTTTDVPWTVEVSKVGTTGAIATGLVRFNADGTLQSVSLADGSNSNPNTLALSLGSGSTTQSINLVFAGGNLSDNASSVVQRANTNGSGNNAIPVSTVGAKVTDGHGTLGISSFSFDERGILQFVYSNGDKKEGPQIALAQFADEASLTYAQGSLFRASAIHVPVIGRATEGGLGKVEGNNLELANVDLTQEFADMLIIQRGYQASSRVMNVANEMLEQLYGNAR